MSIVPPFADRLPTLTATRLRLRLLEENDADALFEIFSDPEVARFWSWEAWTDRDAARRYVIKVHESFAHKDRLQWGMAKEDDRVIGTCTLAHVDWEHRRAELGFALARTAWGHGYANEALRCLLDYAFEELKLHRLEADVDPRNERSIATLERLGFQREGHLRERWHVAGEICDGLFYGLLAHEWK